MSHPSRAASGSGGPPPTFGSPLLSGGFKSLGSKHPTLEFNPTTLSDNAIISNLTYQEKLRTIQNLLEHTNVGNGSMIMYLTSQESDARRIYDSLDPTSKLKASFYMTPLPGSKFNYTWFKELKQGLALVPASSALLALDYGLVNLSRSTHLVVDDAAHSGLGRCLIAPFYNISGSLRKTTCSRTTARPGADTLPSGTGSQFWVLCSTHGTNTGCPDPW
ncbi:hypothetical protein RSOL_443760 [Rhizoctonia solani AG-3 Rhs1AP]|uniref:Uncharacterized protein n=1 Tax=Rhizoctonia solani AG-3 Rhs1AP TaxID=1086054 RepID=X8JPX2_9AGAM|nr:hypothetical protein RSOL_443760 [Rhizoctonia solani AG-3 Rhs1AP]